MTIITEVPARPLSDHAVYSPASIPTGTISSAGIETLDYVAAAAAALMTLGPLAAGMLFWPLQ